MTKDSLVESVAAKMAMSKKQTMEVVETMLDMITSSLAKGEEVTLTGFGSFRVSTRAARRGVNPRTGEKIDIAATKVPKFKAGKGLKDAVK